MTDDVLCYFRTLLPVEVLAIVTPSTTGERISIVRLGSGQATALVPESDLVVCGGLPSCVGPAGAGEAGRVRRAEAT